jgi:hypothetical protein
MTQGLLTYIALCDCLVILDGLLLLECIHRIANPQLPAVDPLSYGRTAEEEAIYHEQTHRVDTMSRHLIILSY